MMIVRSLHEDNSTGEFFIMNLSKDDILLLSKGLESLAKNPMDFNPKRIQKMIRSFNDPNFVVDNENIYPPYAKKDDVHNGHEFVDLGLPSGLLWATCNVGASSPEQAGLYFAWGETTGYAAEQITRGERKFLKKTYKTKKINGNSIFLPAAGGGYDSLVYFQGLYSRYWSGSWGSSNSEWGLNFDSGNVLVDYYYRYYGLSVRGVCER